jgi:hypothetical protein
MASAMTMPSSSRGAPDSFGCEGSQRWYDPVFYFCYLPEPLHNCHWPFTLSIIASFGIPFRMRGAIKHIHITSGPFATASGTQVAEVSSAFAPCRFTRARMCSFADATAKIAGTRVQ